MLEQSVLALLMKLLVTGPEPLEEGHQQEGRQGDSRCRLRACPQGTALQGQCACHVRGPVPEAGHSLFLDSQHISPLQDSCL